MSELGRNYANLESGSFCYFFGMSHFDSSVRVVDPASHAHRTIPGLAGCTYPALG